MDICTEKYTVPLSEHAETAAAQASHEEDSCSKADRNQDLDAPSQQKD